MTILVSIAILALCVLLLGVKVFFVKGGKFPSSHIHDNAALAKKGIRCSKEETK